MRVTERVACTQDPRERGGEVPWKDILGGYPGGSTINEGKLGATWPQQGLDQSKGENQEGKKDRGGPDGIIPVGGRKV